LWGFFFVAPRAVSNAVSVARLPAHKPMRRVQHDVLDRLGVSQKSNRLVVSVLAWVSRSIEQVRRGLADEDRKRRESAQAKELEEQAAKIADLLNEDFKDWARELARLQAATRAVDAGTSVEASVAAQDAVTALPGGPLPAPENLDQSRRYGKNVERMEKVSDEQYRR